MKCNIRDTIKLWASVFGVLGLTFMPGHLLGTWTKVEMGLPEQGKIAFGEGRNDGITRVYATNKLDRVFEYSYSEGSWNHIVIDSFPYPIWSHPYGIALGKGRNDDTLRVYVCYDNLGLYEYTWRNYWWRDTVITGPGYVFALAMGDGRNDGVQRLYTVGGTSLREFTYTDGRWIENIIATGIDDPPRYPSIQLGRGRNDDTIRIYINDSDHINEYTYRNGAWVLSSQFGDAHQHFSSLAVGCGRNDDTVRVYAGQFRCWGKLWEYTYSDTGWIRKSLHGATTHSTLDCVYDLAIGDGRGDGVTRVYGAMVYELIKGEKQSADGLWEWTYTGNAWQEVEIDTEEHYVVAVGSGRGDGVGRVYSRWEYIYSPEGVQDSVSLDFDTEFIALEQNSPNPFSRTGTTISFALSQVAHISLQIYDVTGQLVTTLVNRRLAPGYYNVYWCGKDSKDAQIPNGVYFAQLIGDNRNQTDKITKKLLFIK